jgi:hypothetical protein
MHPFIGRTRLLAGVAIAVVAGSAAMSAAASSKPDKTTFRMFPQAAQVNCLKPHLAFDLFTIQHSPQTATGAPDSNSSVGLAWYQSDLRVGRHGSGHAQVRTVLLDQIFGVDKDVALAPTNTFHLGFWFNNPADAAACGFTGSTPFNGEHNAGPLAFVTRPDATTNLGPLCTDPVGSGGSFHCNP